MYNVWPILIIYIVSYALLLILYDLCKFSIFLILDLAQRSYFKDVAFLNYLKYLLYWKEPEYARYLKYPICLYFLDLLQYEHFRREIVNQQCCKFIDDQAILLWQHYTRRRTKMLQISNGILMDNLQQTQPSNNNIQTQGTNSNQQNGTGNGGGNLLNSAQQNGVQKMIT